MNRNYQKELDTLLALPQTKHQTLLLHSCCAPCSSYVLEYLSGHFDITVFYDNPNITDRGEYETRREEQKRLITELNRRDGRQIAVLEGAYDPACFLRLTEGLENCPEGGVRCFLCYELRLRRTMELAAKKGFAYAATTLSVSPHKNAVKLNEIGERLAAEYGILYLPSDFKKKGGYLRSVELSKEFGLYRQNYCGCVYSRREAGKRPADTE